MPLISGYYTHIIFISWIFIGRTDAEVEAPKLWSPDVKNWLTREDLDAGKDWKQEEKGMTEDEMVGWHHQLDGHEFEESAGSWWWTGKPNMLQSMGLQRVRDDWVTELNWIDSKNFVDFPGGPVGFPDSSVGKELACNARDPSLIPGSGRSPGEGIGYPLQYSWASLVAQLVKNLPAMWETWVWSLSLEDHLEKGKATHSSIVAWRIPWTV